MQLATASREALSEGGVLAAQLDAGARQLELDLLHDPQGGRYASPLAMSVQSQWASSAAWR